MAASENRRPWSGSIGVRGGGGGQAGATRWTTPWSWNCAGKAGRMGSRCARPDPTPVSIRTLTVNTPAAVVVLTSVAPIPQGLPELQPAHAQVAAAPEALVHRSLRQQHQLPVAVVPISRQPAQVGRQQLRGEVLGRRLVRSWLALANNRSSAEPGVDPVRRRPATGTRRLVRRGSLQHRYWGNAAGTVASPSLWRLIEAGAAPYSPE